MMGLLLSRARVCYEITKITGRLRVQHSPCAIELTDHRRFSLMCRLWCDDCHDEPGRPLLGGAPLAVTSRPIVFVSPTSATLYMLVGHREVKDFVLSLLKARRTNFPSPGTCRTKRVVSTLAYQRGVCDEDVGAVHFLKKRGVETWYKNFVNLLRHGSAAFWFIWGKINEKRT